jgi:hypothetical protein
MLDAVFLQGALSINSVRNKRHSSKGQLFQLADQVVAGVFSTGSTRTGNLAHVPDTVTLREILLTKWVKGGKDIVGITDMSKVSQRVHLPAGP